MRHPLISRQEYFGLDLCLLSSPKQDIGKILACDWLESDNHTPSYREGYYYMRRNEQVQNITCVSESHITSAFCQDHSDWESGSQSLDFIHYLDYIVTNPFTYWLLILDTQSRDEISFERNDMW